MKLVFPKPFNLLKERNKRILYKITSIEETILKIRPLKNQTQNCS